MKQSVVTAAVVIFSSLCSSATANQYFTMGTNPFYGQERREDLTSPNEQQDLKDVNYDFGWKSEGWDRSQDGEWRKPAEFDQRETRRGDETKGSYSVEMPNGLIQTVDYFVSGDSGFMARVNYKRQVEENVSVVRTPNSYFISRTRS